jgi:hypothetical protein
MSFGEEYDEIGKQIRRQFNHFLPHGLPEAEKLPFINKMKETKKEKKKKSQQNYTKLTKSRKKKKKAKTYS